MDVFSCTYTVHTHVRHGLSTLSAANIINACIQSTHTTHIHTARTSCYIYCWYLTVCYTQCVGSVLTGSGSSFFWIRIRIRIQTVDESESYSNPDPDPGPDQDVLWENFTSEEGRSITLQHKIKKEIFRSVIMLWNIYLEPVVGKSRPSIKRPR